MYIEYNKMFHLDNLPDTVSTLDTATSIVAWSGPAGLWTAVVQGPT